MWKVMQFASADGITFSGKNDRWGTSFSLMKMIKSEECADAFVAKTLIRAI
jgi:hypothetical protein